MPCTHVPPCPDAHAVDRDAAQVIASYPQQGWSLLCNGVVLFEDTGEPPPDGRTIPPQRGPALRARPADAAVAEVTTTPTAAAPKGSTPAAANPPVTTTTAGTPATGTPAVSTAAVATPTATMP